MPIQSLVHLCSVCLTTHDMFEGALACEQLGFPMNTLSGTQNEGCYLLQKQNTIEDTHNTP